MLQKTLSTAVLDWIFEEQTLKRRFVSREFIGNNTCEGAREAGLGSRKIDLWCRCSWSLSWSHGGSGIACSIKVVLKWGKWATSLYLITTFHPAAIYRFYRVGATCPASHTHGGKEHDFECLSQGQFLDMELTVSCQQPASPAPGRTLLWSCRGDLDSTLQYSL